MISCLLSSLGCGGKSQWAFPGPQQSLDGLALAWGREQFIALSFMCSANQGKACPIICTIVCSSSESPTTVNWLDELKRASWMRAGTLANDYGEKVSNTDGEFNIAAEDAQWGWRGADIGQPTIVIVACFAVLCGLFGKYWLTSHVQSTHFPVQMMNTCISWTKKFYWYRRKLYTQLSSLYHTLSAICGIEALFHQISESTRSLMFDCTVAIG